MRCIWLFLWLPLTVWGGVEAPGYVREANSVVQHSPDKRRSTLRSVLKSVPGSDPIELQAVEPTPPQLPEPIQRRQLSDQERADLRQQLRQQQRPASRP